MNYTQKIAIIKHGGLGDQIVCSAFVREVRRVNPMSHITLLTGGSAADLWKYNAYVNKVVRVTSLYEMSGRDGLDLSKIDLCLSPLAGEDFDLLINPSHDTDVYLTGLISAKVSAPRKVTFFQPNQQFAGYDSNAYYTEWLERPFFENVALYQSFMFQKIFFCEMSDPYENECFITGQDARVAENALSGLRSSKIIGIHGVGSAISRRLAASQLKALCEIILRLGGVPLILGECEFIESLEGVYYSGHLPLMVVAGLVSRLTGVICVDSGIKHLAGVFAIPIVEISHIPKDLMYLNGPYVDGQYKYSAIDFWAPKPGKCERKVFYPQNGFLEADIASGKVIQSFDFASLETIVEALIGG